MTTIVFMGTPDFSVPILQRLIDTYTVIGVVTQPDRPAGRKQQVQMSPIKQLALRHPPRLAPTRNSCSAPTHWQTRYNGNRTFMLLQPSDKFYLNLC